MDMYSIMALVSPHLVYLDNISPLLHIIAYFVQQAALHAHLPVIAHSARMDIICSKTFVLVVFLTVVLAPTLIAAYFVQLDILMSVVPILV